MNQDDFRQMLASRDGGSGGGSGSGGGRTYGGKRNLSERDLAEVKKLSAKKPKKKSKKFKRAETDDAEQDGERPHKSAYRDRAAERRQGVGSDMIDADKFSHLDAEQSKFLGGDMEHTHLVKGLDFALLAQLKREKEKLEHATAAEKQKNQTEEPTQTMQRDQKLAFKSRMGRLVYFHACQSATLAAGARKSTGSELFLPGRMFYTFNLASDDLESTPVSVQRSKEDCPEPDELVNGMVDEELLGRVSELLSSSKTGKKKMRKKKTRIQPQHSRSGSTSAADVAMADENSEKADSVRNTQVDTVNDEDEDIFPDVGDYVPMDQRTEDETVSAAKKAAIKEIGYFSNLSAALSAKEAAAKKQEAEAEEAWKATLQKAHEKQKRLEREQELQAKQAKLASQMDDYAEYQAEGAGALDSDDEDDEETVRRRKAAGLSDRNMKDPEAAETEKMRRKKQKQGNKLSSDLDKINKLMEAKEAAKK